MSEFEIRATDGLSRLGIFSTKHGSVRTPLLMPVVHPRKSAIKPSQLKDEFGFQMVMTNSYIIRSHHRFREKALSDGVHGLLEFDGPIMTDSGTFQMYFHDLPDGEIDPLEIIRFQREIKTDIGTILDAFSDPSVGRSQVEADTKTSLERAQASIPEKGEMMLAGTVQGGVYPDLREFSAQGLAKLDFDVHPIGGVVPLMESYRYSEIVDATIAAKKHLPGNRPVHLFGCGHPMFFAQAALLGCDFFDSASYAKFAEAERLLLPSGTVHLENLRELPCECPFCSVTTADELRRMKKDERHLALMKHNLFVSAGEMRRVRQAIGEGKLFELAAMRARSHPSLHEALIRTLELYERERIYEPIGKTSSVFYTGYETTRRPEITGFHSRLIERFPFVTTKSLLVVPHRGDRPFSETTTLATQLAREYLREDLMVVFVTPMGAIPSELEHVHPAQQCIFPKEVDRLTLEVVAVRLNHIIEKSKPEGILWLDRDTATNLLIDSVKDLARVKKLEKADDIVQMLPPKEDVLPWTKRKLHALLAYQWNLNVNPTHFDELEIIISRSTGKIRHVKRNNSVLYTVVPTTGLLTPTFEGGALLREWGITDDYIVVIDSEVREFVAKGKSALAKFVKQASSNLLAGEEVLVVDEDQDLLGVGRANLNGRDMLSFVRGVAVSIRHQKGH
ncbi:MAG: tRNA guanosine(15) transglycosylase TgtA [Candidatus Hodarchaeota archaeon]